MHEISFADAVREAMVEAMRRDPTVFLMGEDVGAYGGIWGVSQGMLQEFGAERVRDTPISEAAILGAGLGAAMMGMRPIVEIMFGDFLPCAGDLLINQIAKARAMSGGQLSVPLTIRTTTGAAGAGAAQHSQSPESWYMNIPGLKLAVPATPADAKGLLATALRGEDPVLFFEPKTLYREIGSVPDEPDFAVPFGQARIARPGRHVTLIAIGAMLPKALAAAEQMAQAGLEAEVIDPRTLVPLDKDTLIQSVVRTNRVVIAHEAHTRSGPGAEIAALLADEAVDYLDGPIVRVGARNVPLPYSPALENAVLPQVDDIIAAVRRICGHHPGK